MSKIPSRRFRLNRKNMKGKVNTSVDTPSYLMDDKQEISSASSTNFPKGSKRIGTVNNLVDKNLAKFIISINSSFDVVELPCFLNFVKSVTEFGPEYELPSSSTLQMKYIPDIESDVHKYVRSTKESWTSTGCTIMLQMENNLVTILACSPKGVVYLKSQEITNSETEGIVSSAIEYIGAENVVQIITNSDMIFDSIRHMLTNKYPHIFLSRCIAHEIRCLLKAIYDEVKWVREMIDHGELIVRYIHEHDFLLSLLREYTTKELKLPCMYKFASKHLMLQSVFDNKSVLQNLVTSITLSDCNIAKKIVSIIQSREFWSQGQEVLNTLKPIVQVLCLVEHDGPTSGYLYQGVERARKEMKKLYSIDQKRYSKILELFEEWRSKKIIHPIQAAAAFLNPSLMGQWDPEIKAGLEYVFENLVSNEEKNSFVEQMLVYHRKGSTSPTEIPCKTMETSHPCLWWDNCGNTFPTLRKYAMRLLSQPCKCWFGPKGNAFESANNKKASTLTPESWENYLFVAMNTVLMERFTASEENFLRPINPESCNDMNSQIPEEDWLMTDE